MIARRITMIIAKTNTQKELATPAVLEFPNPSASERAGTARIPPSDELTLLGELLGVLGFAVTVTEVVLCG
jgi:hypothetical protein